MVKYIKIILLFIITIGSFALTSCKENRDNIIDMDRSKLVLRLFDSLETGNHASAINQARKLQSYYPKSIFLINLIENETITLEYKKIQKALDANDLEKAYELIRELNGTFPLNKSVSDNMARISELIKLNKKTDNNIVISDNFKQLFPRDYRNFENNLKK